MRQIIFFLSVLLLCGCATKHKVIKEQNDEYRYIDSVCARTDFLDYAESVSRNIEQNVETTTHITVYDTERLDSTGKPFIKAVIDRTSKSGTRQSEREEKSVKDSATTVTQTKGSYGKKTKKEEETTVEVGADIKTRLTRLTWTLVALAVLITTSWYFKRKLG